MWYFILGAVVVGILWYRQTCINQRKEYTDKYGAIDELARLIIDELKDEYPNHQVMKHTVEDFNIHCMGKSHDFLVFFSYNPSGVAVRVDFTSMLGQRRVVEEQFLPHELNRSKVRAMITRAIGIN